MPKTERPIVRLRRLSSRWYGWRWRGLARLRRSLRDDARGQDLIEYALMAGFVAVAAGALLPTISTSISSIFSNVSSLLTAASS